MEFVSFLLTVFLATSNLCYASPSSGDAYCDQQLTPNFEIAVKIFCVPLCFHMRIPKSCMSVCLSISDKKKSP